MHLKTGRRLRNHPAASRLCFLVFCAASGIAGTMTAAEHGSKPLATQGTSTIVCFGDSITCFRRQPPSEGWVSLLEKRLNAGDGSRHVRVVNAGVGGNTSREGLARIEKDVLAHKPDLVTIEFGNDSTDDKKRHVDSNEFENNLAAIVLKVQAVNPKAVIVMMTFPPVDDHRHKMGSNYGGLDKYTEAYRMAVRRFAQDRKLVLFDLDAVIRPHIAQFVRPDGIHLTKSGNKAVAAALEPVIRDALLTLR